MNGKTCLIVITGASRGIGREIALQLSKTVAGVGSAFVLMARNEAALAEVKEIMLRNNADLRVELLTVDFSKQAAADVISDKIRTLEEEGDFEQRLVVHNAGSVGDMTKKSSQLSDESQWHDYLQTNLVSTIALNNQIFFAMKKEAQITIVNITSLLSIKPFSSFTQYSVGKAAREAYFRAFATEHPQCRVLSYSPGPVDTDMHNEVCEKTYDDNVKKLFSKRHEGSTINRKLLTVGDTVTKFLGILEKNKFESGDRVDYFDDE